jgi:hypothetical protein
MLQNIRKKVIFYTSYNESVSQPVVYINITFLNKQDL